MFNIYVIMSNFITQSPFINFLYSPADLLCKIEQSYFFIVQDLHCILHPFVCFYFQDSD